MRAYTRTRTRVRMREGINIRPDRPSLVPFTETFTPHCSRRAHRVRARAVEEPTNTHMNKQLSNLTAGQCYTVKAGRLKGLTGIAVESGFSYRTPVHILQSPEFREVSFFRALHMLRRATPREEVRFLRLCADL